MRKPKWVSRIARRKMKNGTPIGPYLMTKSIKGDLVTCDILKGGECLMLKGDLYVYDIPSLPVSEEKMRRLKSGRDICVMHPKCKTWMNVMKKQPELIRFFTLSMGYDAIFTVEYVKLRWDTDGQNIVIVVNEQIL